MDYRHPSPVPAIFYPPIVTTTRTTTIRHISPVPTRPGTPVGASHAFPPPAYVPLSYQHPVPLSAYCAAPTVTDYSLQNALGLQIPAATGYPYPAGYSMPSAHIRRPSSSNVSSTTTTGTSGQTLQILAEPQPSESTAFLDTASTQSDMAFQSQSGASANESTHDYQAPPDFDLHTECNKKINELQQENLRLRQHLGQANNELEIARRHISALEKAARKDQLALKETNENQLLKEEGGEAESRIIARFRQQIDVAQKQIEQLRVDLAVAHKARRSHERDMSPPNVAATASRAFAHCGLELSDGFRWSGSGDKKWYGAIKVVNSWGPARAAGVLSNDLILSVNTRNIFNLSQLRDLMVDLSPEEPVSLMLQRTQGAEEKQYQAFVRPDKTFREPGTVVKTHVLRGTSLLTRDRSST